MAKIEEQKDLATCEFSRMKNRGGEEKAFKISHPAAERRLPRYHAPSPTEQEPARPHPKPENKSQHKMPSRNPIDGRAW
jgi:hypothetical protein